ncbi:MAG: ABC transporter substrate-binding protein [Clostridiaceae bacterium]|nr:ABC transporter substrate-binding protein [Clostridiaceae bacterium]
MEKVFKGSIAKGFACFVVLAIVISMFFSGCSSAEASEGKKDDAVKTETETPVKDSIVIAMESEPPTLHPFDHKAVTAGYMNTLTFNQLFKTDIDTLEPVPDLCESYESVSDTEWIFKIYDNITFHDGSHMTAEDVKASMEWAKTFTTTKDYTSFWTAIDIVDEYTIKVTTAGPYALTLNNLASIKIVPKALIDSGHDFGSNPIGSGPYKFVAQTLGDKIEFEAFDQYFDKEHRARIKNMTWRVIPEGSSRTIALEAGEVDVIIEVESNDISRMNENQDITVYNTDGTRVNFMAMNSEVAPFNNKDFRRALNAAVDRDSVITVACNGQGTKTISQTPMMFEGASNTNAQDYDIAKAKEYLAASGVDPTTVVFSCIVSNDTARRAAEVIQANLQEIGITMEIENMDYATQLTAIMSGNYESSIIGYTSSTMCTYLQGLYHSDAINAANLSRIKDDYVDSMINLGKTQIDVKQRGETFTKVTEYLNDWAPFVPLYQSVVTRATSSSLEGFKVSASGGMRFEDVYWAQ